MPPISFLQECKRKLFHLSSLWMSFAMHFMERKDAIALFAVLTVTVVLIESARHRHPRLLKAFNFLFGGMLREHERDHTFSGAVYVLLAATLAVVLFPQDIAITAFTIMVVADTVAALVGIRWGKHKLVDGKSLEGAIAFFVSAVLVVLVCSYVYVGSAIFLWAGIAGAAASTLIELFSKKLGLDDNLTITLSAAAVMYLGVYLF